MQRVDSAVCVCLQGLARFATTPYVKPTEENIDCTYMCNAPTTSPATVVVGVFTERQRNGRERAEKGQRKGRGKAEERAEKRQGKGREKAERLSLSFGGSWQHDRRTVPGT